MPGLALTRRDRPFTRLCAVAAVLTSDMSSRYLELCSTQSAATMPTYIRPSLIRSIALTSLNDLHRPPWTSYGSDGGSRYARPQRRPGSHRTQIQCWRVTLQEGH